MFQLVMHWRILLAPDNVQVPFYLLTTSYSDDRFVITFVAWEVQDIANMFMKKDINKEFDIDFILSKEVICNYTKEIFQNLYKKEQSIGKKELLILSIIEKFLVKSIITFEELKLIVNIIEENFTSIYNESGKIYLFRKFGVPFVVGCLDYKKVKFEKDVVKIIEVDLTKEINCQEFLPMKKYFLEIQ